jgi:PEP-CTERM motif
MKTEKSFLSRSILLAIALAPCGVMAQTAVYTWGSSTTDYGGSGGALLAGESSKPYDFNLVYQSGSLLPSTPTGSAVITNIAGDQLPYIDSEWLPGLGPNPGTLIIDIWDEGGPLTQTNTMLFDISPVATPSGWMLTQIAYTARFSYSLPADPFPSAVVNFSTGSQSLVGGLNTVSYAPGEINNIVVTDALLGIWGITFTYSQVPEPSSMLLGALGVLGLVIRRRR